jgi:hypothetical protein
MSDLVFCTKDCPMAGGRLPQEGEQMYAILFPLDDGRTLEVRCGLPGMQSLRTMLREIETDEFIDRVMNSRNYDQ